MNPPPISPAVGTRRYRGAVAGFSAVYGEAAAPRS